MEVKTEPEEILDTKTVFLDNLQAEGDEYSDLKLNETLIFKEEFNNCVQRDSYQCSFCYETFEYQEFLEIHQHTHRIKIKKCPCCKRTYVQRKMFDKHIRSHIKKHLKCEFCGKIFFMKMSHIMHIAQHKKDVKMFVCCHCEKSFRTKKELTIHERVHTNERPYKCGKCGKSFKQSNSAQTHMNTHSEEKKFACEVCAGAFATASSMRRHMKRMHENNRKIVCKLCEEEFLNLESFSKHRMDKHPHLKKFVQICEICSEEFVTKSGYAAHRKVHKERGEFVNNSRMRQICLICDVSVAINLYSSHQNDHLEMSADEIKECERKSKFACKTCGAVTSSKKSAVRHLGLHLEKTLYCSVQGCPSTQNYTYVSYARHYDELHQKFTCKSCKTSLSGYREARRHRKLNCSSHSKRSLSQNMRVYICKRCKSTFTSYKFLVLHYEIHKRSMYFCHTCNKKFSRLNYFKKHMFAVHEQHINTKSASAYQITQDQIAPSEEIPKNTFYCGLCRKVFYSRKLFEQHEKTHFKTRWQCKRCKKVFLRQAYYAHHVQHKSCSWLAEAMLAEVNDFKCTLCDKVLSNLRNFTRHVLCSHGKGDFRCRHCESRFTSFVNFRTHLVAKHPNVKKYFCTLCDADGFVTFRQFFAHKRWHKRENHVKDVVRYVTVEEMETRNTVDEVKVEILSDEDFESVDVPDEVIVNKGGQIEAI